MLIISSSVASASTDETDDDNTKPIMTITGSRVWWSSILVVVFAKVCCVCFVHLCVKIANGELFHHETSVIPYAL